MYKRQKFLRGLGAETRGVDAADQDGVPERIELAKELARTFNCVAAITGATDVASDGEKVLRVDNGCAQLSGVTGTGCMSTTLVAGLCGAARPEDYLLCAACLLYTSQLFNQRFVEPKGFIHKLFALYLKHALSSFRLFTNIILPIIIAIYTMKLHCD